MEDVWNILIEYETRDLVERAYRERHGRTLSASAVREITSSFIQAREYYLNAKRSAITVRPLLQYYGVLALSRGLVLTLSKGLSASALKSGHGLETKDWNGVLNNGLTTIGDLQVEIRKGAFYELITATQNKNYFKANSSRVNWQIPFEIPDVGNSFNLESIVERIPDISREYEVWKAAKFISIKLNGLSVDNEQSRFELTLPTTINQDWLKYVFPDEMCSDLNINRQTDKIIISYTGSFIPYFAQLTDGPFGIGDVYIVPPPQHGIYLNTISLYYAASYFLGMLARYFPSTWISLGRVEKGDSIWPLINRLMDLIQERVPEIVLDLLRGPYDFEK